MCGCLQQVMGPRGTVGVSEFHFSLGQESGNEEWT